MDCWARSDHGRTWLKRRKWEWCRRFPLFQRTSTGGSRSAVWRAFRVQIGCKDIVEIPDGPFQGLCQVLQLGNQPFHSHFSTVFKTLVKRLSAWLLSTATGSTCSSFSGHVHGPQTD